MANQKKTTKQIASEARTVAENLKRPVANLITGTIETSLNVVETAIAGAGEVARALIDEAERLREKFRKGIEAAIN